MSNQWISGETLRDLIGLKYAEVGTDRDLATRDFRLWASGVGKSVVTAGEMFGGFA